MFLLDEPLSNLDAQLRDDTRAELKQLHEQLGITTIYVTHDQVEAMTLADRVVVLDRGRIQQIGEPQSVYARPANRMVATFLGNPPMNIMPAIYTGDNFKIGEQFLPCPQVVKDRIHPVEGRFDLGIRPEFVFVNEPQRRTSDLALGDSPLGREEEEKGNLTVVVRVVEPLGREILIRTGLVGTDVQMSVLGAAEVRLRPGDRLSLSLDLNQLFVFDAATGNPLYS